MCVSRWSYYGDATVAAGRDSGCLARVALLATETRREPYEWQQTTHTDLVSNRSGGGVNQHISFVSSPCSDIISSTG